MAKDWDAVAAAIRLRLNDLDMTQTELAKRSGVSYATVRDLLKNPKPRNMRTLAALSDALGWPAGHLAAVLGGHDAVDPDAGDPVLGELDNIRSELRRLSSRLDAVERQLAGDDEGP